MCDKSIEVFVWSEVFIVGLGSLIGGIMVSNGGALILLGLITTLIGILLTVIIYIVLPAIKKHNNKVKPTTKEYSYINYDNIFTEFEDCCKD